RRNLPFRQAHGVVGRIVAHCQEKNCELVDLALTELQQFSDLIDADVYGFLSVDGSVNSRLSAGGTGRARVEEALAQVERMLGMEP
ncbi:MAG: argininosuccinate lyase, partial [Proteobacteria bacterium]|nr:argininosuccinate lyase [Pseudomonadota bacterium]